MDIALFTPSGELDAAIDELTSEIVVSSGVDTGIIESVSDTEFGNGANLAWVEADGVQEFIAFRDVVQNGAAITLQIVARGCLDTAPTAFPAGARVWFLSQASEVVEIRAPIPPATEVVNAITFQPYNNWGEYPFNMLDFVELPVGVLARRDKVYCPTDVRFNAESYPPSITGELGTLVHTETGVTGTSWTYLAADEIAESGLGRLNNHLQVRIRTWGRHGLMRRLGRSSGSSIECEEGGTWRGVADESRTLPVPPIDPQLLRLGGPDRLLGLGVAHAPQLHHRGLEPAHPLLPTT